MNIERKARQQLFARPQKAFLYPAPGCVEALAAEVDDLIGELRTPAESPPAAKRLKEAVVLERASYRSLLEIALRVTTAQEMTIVIADGPVHNRAAFEGLLAGIDWELFLETGDRVSVRADSFESSLYHEGLLKSCVETAIQHVGATSVVVPSDRSEHRIRVHLSRNLCRVELSLAGEPLWKRGYRGDLKAVAPFREELSQAAIQMALGDAGLATRPPQRLFVPFAGSGTFLFEYLIRALRIPPFLFRSSYAFEHFPAGLPPSADWVRRKLIEELSERLSADSRRSVRALLVERSSSAIESVHGSLARFRSLLEAPMPGVGGASFETELETADVFTRPWRSWVIEGSSEAEEQGLFLPLNPPFGRRVSTSSPEQLYERIGRACSELASAIRPASFAGFILCPSESSWSRFLDGSRGLAHHTRHLSHGGIDLRLCSFRG